MSDRYTLGEPIVALATPHGSAALCVLRLSGYDICRKIPQFFSRPQALSQSHQMTYGLLVDQQGQPLDEVMICCFHAPRSYTGEDMIEIYPHGNMYLVEKILQTLFVVGFRLALPGEFTYRATLLGKMDMVKAEAIHELIMAKSNQSAKQALTRLTGRLSALLEPVYAQLIHISSYLRMHLDYPEEEVEPLPNFDLTVMQDQLQDLLRNSRHLKRWQNGATVVIVGPPNAGKSSLFNLLLQQDRALVSSTAGTTRDYLEADIQLEGFPVRIIDTAGLRMNTDEIESLGIQKSLALLEEADLILHMTDIYDVAHLSELQAYQDKVLTVVNKSDLGPCSSEYLTISVLKHEGITELISQILGRLDFAEVGQQNQSLMLGSIRQQQLCEKALTHMNNFVLQQKIHDLDGMSFHIQAACTALSDLLGKNLDQEINTAMFSQFCLGK